MQCNFSDDELETLQLVINHALTESEEVHRQIIVDRSIDNFDDYMSTMADAERTIRDLKRIREEVSK